jgi:hypothetical protein
MKTLRLIAIAGVCALMCACATTHDRYNWGTYESSLYLYYKDPATEAKFSQSLQALIATAQQNRSVVAPGLYAEYGYLLLKQGKSQDAIHAFREEEDHWPESKVFMDQMIKAASSAGQTAKGS